MLVVVVLQQLEVSNDESLGGRGKLQRELYGIHKEIVAPYFIYNHVHSHCCKETQSVSTTLVQFNYTIISSMLKLQKILCMIVCLYLTTFELVNL